LRTSTSVLSTILTSLSSVRTTAVNLADIPRRCVACVLFWAHLFETFDCVYFQRSCNVSNLERVNLLQEQVVVILLILAICQTSTAFLVIKIIKTGRSCAVCSLTIIDEVKNSDASTDVNNSIKDVNDFLVTVSSAFNNIERIRWILNVDYLAEIPPP